MAAFFTALAASFGVVFVAELGDKSQLLAVGFGARWRLRTVVLGMTLGYATAGLLAAGVGGLLGATLPERPIAIVGGAVFLLFAVLALRDARSDDEDDDDESGRVVSSRSVVASVGLSIALAEFGDKTQLATATLAARGEPVATYVGATGGMVAAGVLGAVAGDAIGRSISQRTMKLASAALFAAFGVLMIATA